MAALLSVQDLSLAFSVDEAPVTVVRRISFDIARGDFVGLVGESGSGKTVTALAILRLLPPQGRIVAGRIELDGQDLRTLDDREMRTVRGRRIAMVFQDAMSALNPVLTIGFQIAEVIRAHRATSRRAAAREAERLLDLVAIPAARQRLEDYPHQLSGGQRQRVMIAMSLASNPDLLIADEPTTALDVTVQAQILELLERLRQELGLTVLLITHDLAVIAESCDRALVMYAGQLVEEASVRRLFAAPSHPYTRGLMRVAPRLGRRREGGRLPSIPGQIPAPGQWPAGCAFHPRCPEVFEVCDTLDPRLVALADRHRVRCFLHHESTVDGRRS